MSRLLFSVAAQALALLVAPTVAQAQCPAWGAEGLPGVQGSIDAVATWDPVGPVGPLLVVGGGFPSAGTVPASNIAAWDGSNWQAIGGGVNGAVRALTVYNGDLIAAGTFTTAGGAPANRIARWNGSTWQSLGSGMELHVWALTVYNGELIAAGSFTTAGGAPANRIARWNGSSWQSLGSGMDSEIRALAVYNGELVAGGTFTTAGGVPARGIARWNGSSWQKLGIPAGGCPCVIPCCELQDFNPLIPIYVYALTVHQGWLVAAGYINTIMCHCIGGGTVGPYLCAGNVSRWNGTSWEPFSGGINATVWALTVHNGELIAGGKFNYAGGPNINNIARWTGTAWQPLSTGVNNPDPNTNTPVRALTVYNGELIAGGNFTSAGGVNVKSIARWSGANWQAVGGGPFGGGLNAAVLAAVVHAGDLIVGGYFTTAGGVTANRIARWDGSTWHALGTGMNGPVHALATHNGQLIAGGEFTLAGGQSANQVARWDGTSWQPLAGGLTGPGNAGVLALTSFNSSLIAGGFFQIPGAPPTCNVATWNGTTWQAMGNGLSDGTVNALAVHNGELLAGGTFSPFVGPHTVARWTGSAWQTLGTATGAAWALTSANGSLYAAGGFSSPPGRVIRWNGSMWLPTSDQFAVGAPNALAEYNGALIVGGTFQFGGGGQTLNGMARHNGSSWGPIGTGFNGAVNALAVHAGYLVAGGSFSAAGSVGTPNIARWGDCLGACCVNGSCIEATSEFVCVGMGGAFAGHNSVCSSAPCAMGACCPSNGPCVDAMLAFECAAAGGTFAGSATTCSGTMCQDPCPADTNDDGQVNVVDLVNVILDWGTDGTANGGDVNQDGTVAVADLVEVILAWGLCF